MKRVLLVSLAALAGCGPITPIKSDGGAGGPGGGSAGGFVLAGGQTGGGSTTGGGSSGGSVSGGSAAGGSSRGSTAGGSVGGGSAGGGLGPFTWTSVSALPAPSTGVTARAVTARPGEAYLAIGSSLYRSTGAAFDEVAGFALSGMNDIWVTPMGKVFAVSNSPSSRICTATDCSMGSNFVMQLTGETFDYFDGLCGAGESVFAIGNGNNSQAILFEFNGTGWTKVSNDLGFRGAKKCVVDPAGGVFVLGPTFVVRYEGGGFSQENVALNGQLPAEWLDLAFSFGAGGDGMLVGRNDPNQSTSSYRFARRNTGGGAWTVLPSPMMGTLLNSVANIGVGEFIAAGNPGGTAPRFMQWNGTMWVASTNQPPSSLLTVSDAASASDREVYLVGSGGSGYVVIRGRR